MIWSQMLKQEIEENNFQRNDKSDLDQTYPQRTLAHFLHIECVFFIKSMALFILLIKATEEQLDIDTVYLTDEK